MIKINPEGHAFLLKHRTTNNIAVARASFSGKKSVVKLFLRWGITVSPGLFTRVSKEVLDQDLEVNQWYIRIFSGCFC